MTTKDQVAQLIVAEARARGHSRDECLAEMSCLYQESGWDDTVWDATHTTYGIAQQDASYPNRSKGAAAQIAAFFDRLDTKRKSPGHGDIWLNLFWLQQAPSRPTAQLAYDLGRKAYLTEIKSRVATVTPYLDKHWPTGEVVTDTNKPPYNEFAIWSPSASSRGNDKPTAFLIHTQEGGGGNAAAEDLANFLANGANQVSYHYSVSQASDGGVTVVDCVDTDEASWSVGNANSMSINLCFAGSKASWTRSQWLAQANAIDVAAYLAVQDARKYGFSTLVVPPPYSAGTPGISDHKWVTDVFKWGTHTDVGAGFPWDVFATAINKYATGLTPEVPVVVTPTPKPVGPADDQLTLRWNCLGGQTLVEAVAQIRDKVCGTSDRDKTGAV